MNFFSELTASTCHSHLNSSWQTLSLSEGSCELSLHAKYLHVGQKKNDLIVSEGLHQVLLNLWKFPWHLGQTRHFYCQPSTLRWWAIRGRYVYGGRNSSMKKVMWTVSWATEIWCILGGPTTHPPWLLCGHGAAVKPPWSQKIAPPFQNPRSAPGYIHYPTTWCTFYATFD